MTGDSAKSSKRRLTKNPENQQFITDRLIERLLTASQSGDAVNRIIWDYGMGAVKGKLAYAVSGFGVRTTVSGQVAFIFNYHAGPKGKRKEHRIKFGEHSDYTASEAREKARGFAEDLKKGINPLRGLRALENEPTFAELAKAWLEYAKTVTRKRETSLYDDHRMLGLNQDGEPIVDKNPAMQKKRILPVLGEFQLREITKINIARFHNSLRETPYRANRVLVLIKTIFNYGMTDDSPFKEWIAANPAEGIKTFPEDKKERCLNEEEIERFQRALDEFSNQNAANCLRLLLLTGSRVGETLKARWEDFDLESGKWTKPSHHTKQKKTEKLSLGEAALDLLRSMKPKNATGPLFPAMKMRKDGERYRDSLKRPWIAACRAAGLGVEVPIKDEDGKPRLGRNGDPLMRFKPNVRVHDLRHTYASWLVSNGVGLEVIGKSLGHVQASTTARYSHVQDEAVRAGANHLAEIIKFKKRA